MRGVIRKASVNDRSYYTADDVMNIFGDCKDKAYKMIRTTRKELISEGRIYDDYPKGKVPKSAGKEHFSKIEFLCFVCVCVHAHA